MQATQITAMEHDQAAVYLDSALLHIRVGLAKRSADVETAKCEFGHALHASIGQDVSRILSFGADSPAEGHPPSYAARINRSCGANS